MPSVTSPPSDDELLPLRDLAASDWLLRGLFVLLVLVGVASQLSQEITEWLYGAPTQSAK